MQRYQTAVTHIRHEPQGKLRYESMLYPEFNPRSTDYYIIAKQMDRLDIIASDWYGDPRLWWVISRANNLPGGSLRIKPGTRIRIPWPLNINEIETLLIDKQI